MPTLCNPLNISYRYQLEGINDIPCREAADPSMVLYKDRYWLFLSKSSGYWSSDDLYNWTFHKSTTLPVEDYAPDVRVIDDWLVCTASRNDDACPIFKTQTPEDDSSWQEVSAPFPFWDPNIYQDDDGRVYLYWGCSDVEPLYGIELDRKSLTPIGEKVVLFGQSHDIHGWERKSEYNRVSKSPHIEGLWMTKHNGRYYLQYAGPGTEFNIYGDGVYEADAPLGPYTYAANNPFSFKPGGYMNGAGHGSTCEDHYDNLWHISTMSISVKHMFERRIGLWPTGFDSDGVMYCNTRFGDYPHRLAEAKLNDPWTDTFTGWMLLNYNASVEASSALPDYPATQAVNECARDYWAATKDDAAPTLTVTLDAPATLHALQVNFADHECQQRGLAEPPLYQQFIVEGSTDGENWITIWDQRNNKTDLPHTYCELETPTEVSHVRLTITHMPAQGHGAVSGLRLFGLGKGQAPAAPAIATAKLHADDPMTAHISWDAVDSAIGYNLRWGFAPDKLYHDWLIYDDTSLDLGALNKGQDTWVAIEAFNANGVSALSEPVKIV